MIAALAVPDKYQNKTAIINKIIFKRCLLI